MLVYLPLDIICSSKLRSGKIIRILELITLEDKYPCTCSRQIEDIVYTSV